MTEARERKIYHNNLRNTRNWCIKKYWLRKKRNILNRPSIKRERRRIAFGVPHDEACNYAVFQSSAKFNKSISIITRNKTEQKKFAKNQIREKGMIRLENKRCLIYEREGPIANF